MALATVIPVNSHRKLLNVEQARAILGISRRTIYYWFEKGWLEYVRMPSGRRLIYADSLLSKGRPS